MPSIRSYFFAKFYDATMKDVEEACLSTWRADLLAKTTGDVLEIGAGTGVNISYYPASIRRLVLSEPDPNMRKILAQRLEASSLEQAAVVDSGAEAIDFPAASFDCVVSTLVLCSVKDPSASLQEVYRLLRPGGTLFFIEHVTAKDNPRIARWQKVITPLWKFMCGGCHLTRDTAEAIRQTGFQTDQLERVTVQNAPAVIQPGIRGMAIKPVD